MQVDIFKEILVPVIGGLGIFMLGLEFMSDDEYLEITPLSVRIRKKYLTNAERTKAKKK